MPDKNPTNKALEITPTSAKRRRLIPHSSSSSSEGLSDFIASESELSDNSTADPVPRAENASAKRRRLLRHSSSSSAEGLSDFIASESELSDHDTENSESRSENAQDPISAASSSEEKEAKTSGGKRKTRYGWDFYCDECGKWRSGDSFSAAMKKEEKISQMP